MTVLERKVLFFNHLSMRSFNKVMLHGRLTSDPEVKASQKGQTITVFSVATNRDWKNKDGEVISHTDFHRVVAFGKLGDIVGKYLKKGLPVLLSGRLSNRSYMAADGGKRYITEVVMDDFNFLSRAKKAEEPAEVSFAVEPVAA